MIFIFKNFFRNKMVNLSAKSIRAFIPDANIYCVSLYKEDPFEYDYQEPLNNITNIMVKTKYVNSNNKPLDHIDSTQTSGYQNSDNVKYFSEGYNKIMEVFGNFPDKIVILAEDHFFTSGQVLKELYDNDYDLAYAPWDHDEDANGSIISFNPKAIKHLFPLPEHGRAVEESLCENLVRRVPKDRRYIIKNRKHTNYYNDGLYTNSSAEMEQEMRKAGIL